MEVHFFLAILPQKVQIIPLGGLGEIGKNMTVIRFGDDIIVIDAGLMFPEDDMPGIDLVIPDISYLLDNKDLIRGIILTHGHEDHIGALPYVLKQLAVPVYGTRLTLGILEGLLKENNVSSNGLRSIRPGDEINLGSFIVGFIRVSHSIADAVGISIKTPIGTIVHTGDFKFDQTPVDGKATDFHKFAELGDQGVLVLLSDSTDAESPGFTKSEKTIGANFEEVFRNARERIIIATSSTNIHRIQQAVNIACKYKRKVAILGRSMTNVINIALELGYLNIAPGVMISPDEINKYPTSGVVILTTGSQGDQISPLSRIAMSEYRKIDIITGDTVIISANPIPGNEKSVSRTIDILFRQGAEVIYDKSSGAHVSGHASQEELKLMHNLIRPRFFVPIHGEYRHLIKHAKLAEELGMPKENIIVAENGHILEFTQDTGSFNGKITAGNVLVDGLGVGDVGNIVLRDRRQLAKDGILIVVITMDRQQGCLLAGPDFVSRGFVYVRESEQLMDEAKEKAKAALERCEVEGVTEWGMLKASVRDALGKYLYEKTRRRPMILPIIMEV